MRYRDSIVVRRSSGGTQAADGGWTPSTTTTLYSGACDVQEMGYARIATDDGILDAESDPRVFVPEPTTVETILPGDEVVVTFAAGDSRSGQVTRIRRLDDSFDISIE